MSQQEKTDHRKARGALTRRALMQAAERLMATRGLGNVTIRQIVAAAKQKNESALQYHFKSLQGLIDAIHEDLNRVKDKPIT
ncbi:MAG: TetR/AcrR family transcriptional regulator, partial [Pseudomonadales bacterium]